MLHNDNAKVFSLTANKELTAEIVKILGIDEAKVQVSHFADGEILCEPQESVRGKNCYVVQSTCNPVTDHLMELLVMVDALRRSSAKSITCVMPYYGYARQDRKAKPRQPITSKLVADLLATAGATRVVCVDLHATQIQGFFSCLVDEMTAIPLLACNFKEFANADDAIIVSPDHGGVNRARKVAERLNLPLAIIDKRRTKPNVAEVMNIIGDVSNKHCIMIDDMIDTAGSASEGAKALLKNGAIDVRIACSHGVFSGPAAERLLNTDTFKEIVTTDSITLPERMQHSKVKVLSLAPMLAAVIEAIENDQPVTEVYNLYSL